MFIFFARGNQGKPVFFRFFFSVESQPTRLSSEIRILKPDTDVGIQRDRGRTRHSARKPEKRAEKNGEKRVGKEKKKTASPGKKSLCATCSYFLQGEKSICSKKNLGREPANPSNQRVPDSPTRPERVCEPTFLPNKFPVEGTLSPATANFT